MTSTTHYGLNIAEGTDNYNHLTVDNPNYQKIDNQMYANAQAGVPLVTMTLQETTIAITRPAGYEKANMFRFVSSVNFNQYYTWTVDGTSVTPSMPNGGALPSQAFIIGSMVLCILNGTALTVYTVPTVDMDSIKIQVMQAIYPVGSIIINENPTNPASTFGFGTWERIQGRFIYAADSITPLNDTGGAGTHTHSFEYTQPQIGWNEGFKNFIQYGYSGKATAQGLVIRNLPGDLVGNVEVTVGKLEGDTAAASSMPPYIAKYIWRRTA